jgi:heme exporter protein A
LAAQAGLMFRTTLQVDGLAARRGDHELFAGVSFRVDAGGGLRLTGPNGSGKTTLLRIIAGLVRPVAGRTRIAGEGAGSSLDDAVSEGGGVHYFGHSNAMKAQLTVRQNLAFWQRFHGASAADAAGTGIIGIDEALSSVGLSRVIDLPFTVLSSGQKRRTAFARLLLGPAAIWLLDEPNAGLDASAAQTLERLIGDHRRKGGIVIAATHMPLGGADWQLLDLGGAAVRHAGDAT